MRLAIKVQTQQRARHHTPGNRKSEVEYDFAGRIATVKDAEGHTTSLRYSPRGQLLAITRDGITQTTLFDAFGNPIKAGYDDGTHYQALARFGYDDAGRNTWIAMTGHGREN